MKTHFVIAHAVLLLTPVDTQLGAAEPPSAAVRFELRVVDSNGQGVAGARVQLRTSPKPTAEDILVGSFDKASRYGNYAKCDDSGCLVFTLSKAPSRFNLSIQTPGYGPYWADWRSNNLKNELPDTFTAELESAWTVGGVVLDELGQPIESATVHPSIEYKKRPGDLGQIGIGTNLKTDAEGRWSYASVPESMREVYVSITHDDYERFGQRLNRDDYEVPADDVATTGITLNAGHTIRGRVADEDGVPIKGALVRVEIGNQEKKATTDEFGSYRLPGCAAGQTTIAVSAPGKALDKRTIDPGKDTESVDFEMQPGGHIRLRVIDENGNGIPKARIFYQRWRGEHDYFSLDVKSQYADENGVWEWNEAPLDGFTADICRPGGMQLSDQFLTPREEEYVFRPPAALIVSGRVTNSVTGEPIKNFRVVPGSRWQNGPHWHQRDAFDSGDGNYKIRLTHGDLIRLIRIEAVGYRPAESRDIAFTEGKINVDFSLTPAAPLESRVLTPDGTPAATADVAIGIANAQIAIKNGRLDTGSTFCKRTATGENGRFAIAAEAPPLDLVITHPTGFAKVEVNSSGIADEIELTPWGRVQGTFRVGDSPGGGVTLEISGGDLDQYGQGTARIFTQTETTTNSAGSFVFERVPPGKSWIHREIVVMVDEGALEVTSAVSHRIDVVPGEVLTLDLGGSGRPVVGRLQPSRDYEGDVNWKHVMLHGRIDVPWPARPERPPQIAKDAEASKRWRTEWLRSPAGRRWTNEVSKIDAVRDSAASFRATIADDGAFRIDDVPPGEYVIGTGFSQDAPGSLAQHRVVVPPVANGGLAEAVDLGTVVLREAKR